MTYPAFHLHRPESLDEAIGLLTTYGDDSALMAGGTDLLPAFGDSLNPRTHVIALSGIPELRRISPSAIGACVTLADLTTNSFGLPPVLRDAARGVAGPAVRSSATIGGNLILSGRCKYFNQSSLSRSARGVCLKAGGPACLAVSQDVSCYAISSGDLVPVMLVLDVTFRVVGPDGERHVSATDFYLPDGIASNSLESSEVLVEILLPEDVLDWTAGYRKLGTRSVVDFPEAAVAVAVKTGPGEKNEPIVSRCRISVGALGPCPREMEVRDEDLSDWLGGDGSDREDRTRRLVDRVWKMLLKDVKSVRNATFRPGYRKNTAKEYLTILLEDVLRRSSLLTGE